MPKVWGDLVCWLWRKLGWCAVTKWQLGALAQLRVQVSEVHRGQFFEFGLKRWLLKHYLSVLSDLQHVWSGLLSWLRRKMRWHDFETALRGFRALGLSKCAKTHWRQFLEFGLKQWLLKHLMSVVDDLQHVWSDWVTWLWRTVSLYSTLKKKKKTSEITKKRFSKSILIIF